MAGFAAAQTVAWFGAAFALGEFGMFLMAAPVNAVLLWSVPSDLRPFTLAAAEFAQHLLGDIPSPPALGWLQGRISNWRVTMCVCTGLLALSAVLFLVAMCRSHGAESYREVAEMEGQQLAASEDEEGEEGAAAESGLGAVGAAAARAVTAEEQAEPLLSRVK